MKRKPNSASAHICIGECVSVYMNFELVMIVVQVELRLSFSLSPFCLAVSSLEMQMGNAFSSNCAIWLAYYFPILSNSFNCRNIIIAFKSIKSTAAFAIPFDNQIVNMI